MENGARMYGYARVSTREQNLDRQIDALIKAGVEERDIIQEKASGKNITERSQYRMLRDKMLRAGDTLVIMSLDRLSRSKEDILNELRFYKVHNVHIEILNLPTTMVDSSKTGKLAAELITSILIEVYAYIAENERVTLLERQKEGIAAARARGKKFGRPPIKRPENFETLYEKVKHGEMTSASLMKLLELKPNTYYRFVHEVEKAKQ